MRRCLSIAEVFYLITQSLYQDRAMHTLASLAATCTGFHDAAENALWKKLRSLLPLLKLFPSDAWIMQNGKFVSFEFILSCTT